MTDRSDLRDQIADAISIACDDDRHCSHDWHGLAQAVIDALGLTPEIGRQGTEQRWVSLWREVGE